MSLYARQLAWLHARPRPAKPKLNEPDPVRRIDAIKASGTEVPLPPCPLPYIVQWLLEIGPTLAAGMGSGPIEWRDIAAWQGVNGVEMLPWEAAALRLMSKAYLMQFHDSEKPDCPAPWSVRVPSADHREAVARKVRNAFMAFSIAQNSKKGRQA